MLIKQFTNEIKNKIFLTLFGEWDFFLAPRIFLHQKINKMIIKLENVFCNPTFCGHRHINIKYVANCVEISDTKGNDICSLGVTKFTVTANEVLFYFVRDGKICQFLSGTISTNTRTFEKGFCKFDEEELLQIAKEFNSCP